MRAKFVLAFVAWLAAGPSWAGVPAEEFRSYMRRVAEEGMQHSAVSGLRGQLELAQERSPKEDWSEVEAEIGEMEKFYHHFYWMKKGGPSNVQEQQALRRELKTVFQKLRIEDPALEEAYLRQIAPPPEVQKAMDRKLEDLGAEAKTEAQRRQYAEVRGLLKNGDYQGAYDKFNKTFDQGTPGGASSIKAVYIRENLRPQPDEDLNQFTEHRKALAGGLDKVKVPAPGVSADMPAYNESSVRFAPSKAEAKKSKAAKALSNLEPDKPKKPGVIRDTQVNGAAAIVGFLCLFSPECLREVAVHESLRGRQ